MYKRLRGSSSFAVNNSITDNITNYISSWHTTLQRIVIVGITFHKMNLITQLINLYYNWICKLISLLQTKVLLTKEMRPVLCIISSINCASFSIFLSGLIDVIKNPSCHRPPLLIQSGRLVSTFCLVCTVSLDAYSNQPHYNNTCRCCIFCAITSGMYLEYFQRWSHAYLIGITTNVFYMFELQYPDDLSIIS